MRVAEQLMLEHYESGNYHELIPNRGIKERVFLEPANVLASLKALKKQDVDEKIHSALYNGCCGGDEGKKLWEEFRYDPNIDWGDDIDPRISIRFLHICSKFAPITVDLTESIALQKKRAFKNFNMIAGQVNNDGDTFYVAFGNDTIRMGSHYIVFCKSDNAAKLRFNKYQYPVIAGTQKNPKVVMKQVFPVWKEQLNINRYEGVVFDPSTNHCAQWMYTGALPLPDKHGNLNTYSGYGVCCIAEHLGDISIIIKHIRERWCSGNEEIFDWIWKWLAWGVQFPWLQIGSVPVLKSTQGAGKGTIIDPYLDFFGRHILPVTTYSDITQQFNAHVNTAVICHLNEVKIKGDVKIGTLKSLVTDKMGLTEFKNGPKVQTTRHCNFIVGTNAENAAPVEIGNRRFSYLPVSDEHANDHDYFKPLRKAMKDPEVIAGWFDALMREDLSDYNPMVIPKACQQLAEGDKLNQLDSVTKWALGLYNDSTIKVATNEDTVMTTSDFIRINIFAGDRKIVKQQIYDDYVIKTPPRYRLSSISFWTRFRRLMEGTLMKFNNVKVSSGSGRKVSVRFPTDDEFFEHIMYKSGISEL